MQSSGVVRKYYTNGLLAQEYFTIGEIKEGLCKHYYSNGDLHMIASYVNGKMHGPFQVYNGGKLHWETNYINGIENGIHRAYYFDGDQIKEEIMVVNGKWKGMRKFYSPNGSLIRRIFYYDPKN